jgi:hypothetical protein
MGGVIALARMPIGIARTTSPEIASHNLRFILDGAATVTIGEDPVSSFSHPNGSYWVTERLEWLDSSAESSNEAVRPLVCDE